MEEPLNFLDLEQMFRERPHLKLREMANTWTPRLVELCLKLFSSRILLGTV